MNARALDPLVTVERQRCRVVYLAAAEPAATARANIDHADVTVVDSLDSAARALNLLALASHGPRILILDSVARLIGAGRDFESVCTQIDVIRLSGVRVLANLDIEPPAHLVGLPAPRRRSWP